MNPHVIITAIDFRKRRLILLCSALDPWSIQRPPPAIKAEFCYIFHVAADIFIKALKILDAFMYSHHFLGDQIID